MRSALLVSLLIALGAPARAQDAEPPKSVFITLGTVGGPIPTPDRAEPSNVLLRGGRAYLIDAGDGAVDQLARAGVFLPMVRAVFISHLHVDHIGGLFAVLGLRDQVGAPGVLTVYGPPGTQAVVDGIVRALRGPAEAGYGIPGQPWAPPETTVKVVELTGGAKFDVDGMTITTAQNTHYDFAPGSPEDARFKSLSYRFDLPDRSIAYTGDTGPSPAVVALAKGADLLVSEMIDIDATMATVARNAPNMPDVARRNMIQHFTTHHLTPEEVGEMAAQAGVRSVVVTHFAGGTPNADAARGYAARIGKRFHGAVRLANDLERF